MPLVNHTELWTSARRGQPESGSAIGGPLRLQLTLFGATFALPMWRPAKPIICAAERHRGCLPTSPRTQARPSAGSGSDRFSGVTGQTQARASLRQAISELKALADREPEFLRVDRKEVALLPSAVTTDIGQLQQAAEKRNSNALEKLRPEHDERFLANLENLSPDFDDWLVIERTRQKDILRSQFAGLSRAEQTSTHDEPRDDAAVAKSKSERSRKFHSWVTATFAVVLITLIGVAAAYFSSTPKPESVTIAVLPFEDLSGGKNIYLGEGISEEIMAQLAQDPATTVIGRTSAWSVRGLNLDAQKIGQRLGVDYLVEGSVRKAGQQIRVDVALIRTRDGSRVWTQRFSEQADSIFAIQDRIASGISSKFRPDATPDGPQAPASVSQVLYVTARGLVGTREAAKLDAAIELLRQASVQDPSFAPSWALLGKALIHRSRPRPNSMAKSPVPPEARSAIKRALQLDPNSADAHLALGMALGPGKGRRAAFERAVKLDPGNSESWAALAFDYRFFGEYTREFQAWRRAATIDPLWPRAFFTASESAWDLGYRKEAQEFSRRAAAANDFDAAMIKNDFGMRRGTFADAFRQGRQLRLSQHAAALIGRYLPKHARYGR